MTLCALTKSAEFCEPRRARETRRRGLLCTPLPLAGGRGGPGGPDGPARALRASAVPQLRSCVLVPPRLPPF